MKFILILHLAPDHESSLPQILQTQTTMPVAHVNEIYKLEQVCRKTIRMGGEGSI